MDEKNWDLCRLRRLWRHKPDVHSVGAELGERGGFASIHDQRVLKRSTLRDAESAGLVSLNHPFDAVVPHDSDVDNVLSRRERSDA